MLLKIQGSIQYATLDWKLIYKKTFKNNCPTNEKHLNISQQMTQNHERSVKIHVIIDSQNKTKTETIRKLEVPPRFMFLYIFHLYEPFMY